MNMHVYLINDAEFVAAADESQAREYAARPGNPYTESEPGEAVEIQLADERGFCDDGYNKETPDRTMIEQAERKLAEGEVLPFHVGVSFDLF